LFETTLKNQSRKFFKVKSLNISMATKIPAAQNRLYKNAFVCKVCKHKIKVEPLKIIGGKVRCRKCKAKEFRPVRKK
jgi:hypothetical protein